MPYKMKEYPRWQRFFAFTTDLFASYVFQFFGGVIGAFVATLFVAREGVTESALQQSATTGFFWGTLFWGTAYWLLNWIFLQGMTGATIGKHIFKLKVVSQDGSDVSWVDLLGRTIVMFLGTLFFGLGVVPILVSKKAQALHDRLFKTKVITVSSSEVFMLPNQTQSDSKDHSEAA